MRTILVTGPIGSGKSEVCRYLASKGWPVYDCDSKCKALYTSVPGLRERIERELDLRFENIGLIFSDPERRLKLESIVYPLLLEDFHSWRDSQTTSPVFIESAIAMDKPVFDREYDAVLCVTSTLENRIGRNPKVAERNAIQNFDMDRVDWTLENNSDISTLHENIDKLLKVITK